MAHPPHRGFTMILTHACLQQAVLSAICLENITQAKRKVQIMSWQLRNELRHRDPSREMSRNSYKYNTNRTTPELIRRGPIWVTVINLSFVLKNEVMSLWQMASFWQFPWTQCWRTPEAARFSYRVIFVATASQNDAMLVFEGHSHNDGGISQTCLCAARRCEG